MKANSRISLVAGLALLGMVLLAPIRALAFGMYLDIGVGANAMFNPTQMFPGTPAALGITASGNSMLGFALNSGAAFQIHLGVAGRLNIGSSGVAPNTTYSSYIGVYPTFRIETYRFYLSAGIAPFLWSRQDTVPGINYTFVTTSALGGFAEIGILWRVASDFHLALAVSADIVAQGANPFASPWSPSPNWGAFVAMRFNIFSTGKGSGSGGSGGSGGNRTYDGWRYPFGVQK